MYLVSLNSDYFFKKVFANLEIAKAFLQDFLDVKITAIERGGTDYKITDNAALIRFDFRCKIDGKWVVIEMQQAHKTDVVKRFYAYHCLDTCLQLENIKEVVEQNQRGEDVKVKDYSELTDVITIVWMVEDTLGSKEDLMSFILLPETWSDFLKDDTSWENFSKKKLKSVRDSLLEDEGNPSRGWDFLPKNRLIYAFQHNIVKNKRLAKYVKWFEFAEKTRNRENKKEDFNPYLNDSNFFKMIQLLTKETLVTEDIRAAMGEDAYWAAKKLGEQREKEARQQQLYWEMHDEIREQLWLLVKDEVELLKSEKGDLYDQLELLHLQTELAIKRVEEEKKQTEAEKKRVELTKKLLEQERAEKKILKAEQRKIKKQQEKAVKLEQEKAEKTLKLEQEKAKKALKLEQEKAEKALKLEQEKIEKALKLEQEKIERALKLEQEKAEKVLKLQKQAIIKNMLEKGLSIHTIVEFLNSSVTEVEELLKIQ